MNQPLIGPHLVPGILHSLSRHATLPPKGVVAGQAVCSAVLELLGKGPAVFNDVDVFDVATAEQEDFLTSNEHLQEEALRLGVPAALLDEYRMLAVGEATLVELLGATSEGALNRVWLKSRSRQVAMGELLTSFDLNAVEIALDLETGELLWTKAFEHFIRTRELQVTSLNTPLRTLLRYYKKRDELGAYGDDELTAGMLVSWPIYCGTQVSYKLLSTRYQALLDQLMHKLPSWLVRNESDQTLEPSDDWLFPEGFEDAVSLATGDLGESEGVVRIVPLMLYGKKLGASKASSQMLEKALADSRAEVCDGSDFQQLVHMSLELMQERYLEGQKSQTHLKLVESVVAKHPNLCQALFGLTLDEQYRCLLDLRKRAKTEGEHVYGCVEQDAYPADMWNEHARQLFFTRLERRETTELLAEPLFETRTLDDVVVRELLTSRALRVEGSQMGHCVGGYSSAVQSGRSRILSLSGPTSSERSTVEVRVVKRAHQQQFVVQQHHSQGNRACSPRHRDVLRDYLRDEAARLGYAEYPPKETPARSDWTPEEVYAF